MLPAQASVNHELPWDISVQRSKNCRLAAPVIRLRAVIDALREAEYHAKREISDLCSGHVLWTARLAGEEQVQMGNLGLRVRAKITSHS